jgi:hypothetical protein
MRNASRFAALDHNQVSALLLEKLKQRRGRRFDAAVDATLAVQSIRVLAVAH